MTANDKMLILLPVQCFAANRRRGFIAEYAIDNQLSRSTQLQFQSLLGRQGGIDLPFRRHQMKAAREVDGRSDLTMVIYNPVTSKDAVKIRALLDPMPKQMRKAGRRSR